MRFFRFKQRSKWIDFLLGIFIVLLIIPQTGRPIQIGINKLKLLVWSPSVKSADSQLQIQPFTYQFKNLEQQHEAVPIGNGEPTFLSFWATWCAPCVAELSSIEALYKDYGEAINFVLVTREAPEVVNRFLHKKGYTLPVYFPLSQLPKTFQSNSIPTNFLIDGKGNILIKETGAANWNSKKVREVLDELIQTKDD